MNMATIQPLSYSGYRFPAVIFSHCTWLHGLLGNRLSSWMKLEQYLPDVPRSRKARRDPED